MNPAAHLRLPKAATTDPMLVKHQAIFNKTYCLLERLKEGRCEKSFFLVGLRGVGKTALLTAIDKQVTQRGYHAIFIKAEKGKSLTHLLIPALCHLLHQLNSTDNIHPSLKKAFRILKSFMNSLPFKFSDPIMTIEIEPEKGSADSGDLEFDLPGLLQAIAEVAKELKTVIVIILDDTHHLLNYEISALIRSIHCIVQKNLPLAFIGTGLPHLIGLTGHIKSYSERLFDFITINAF